MVAGSPRAEDEIKHDGFRMLVRRDAAGVRLSTRNAHDWERRKLLLIRLLANTTVGLQVNDHIVEPGNVVRCASTAPTLPPRCGRRSVQSRHGRQKIRRRLRATGASISESVAFGASPIHIFWISSRFSCSCCPRRASIKLIVVCHALRPMRA